jgi:hypothetical protein
VTAEAIPNEVTPESTVSYTVKELLAEQTTLLRQIDAKVDGKADKTDLVPLVLRLDDHHGRISHLEDVHEADRAAADVRATFRRRAWLTLTAVVVPLATALIIVYVRPY